MLGPAKPRRLDQPIAVSLEDLIPQDADRGRPSIDPVVFFTLQLVMFFEGSRPAPHSGRAIVCRPRPNVDVAAYCTRLYVTRRSSAHVEPSWFSSATPSMVSLSALNVPVKRCEKPGQSRQKRQTPASASRA